MPNFLFWNVNRRPIGNLISVLAAEHNVETVVLAENTVSPLELLTQLNAKSVAYHYVPSPIPHARIQIYSVLGRGRIDFVRDFGGITIRHVRFMIGDPVLVVAAHLGSKLHLNEKDQAALSARLPSVIEQAELTVGHARTVVMGDLNMDPFEPGVAGAEGLHGVMTRQIALKESRVVDNETRKFFYNPMWSRFGDRLGHPPGTYFRPGSSPTAQFWHIFDQVLIRPDLLGRFDDSKLLIPTRVGKVSLLTPQGRPNRKIGSDHLPLVFSIQ